MLIKIMAIFIWSLIVFQVFFIHGYYQVLHVCFFIHTRYLITVTFMGDEDQADIVSIPEFERILGVQFERGLSVDQAPPPDLGC